VQIVVATHSAILLTLPGATILSFDGGHLREVRLEETSHYQITRGILESPARYWKHLLRDDEPAEE
jgi:predicted ATPase